MRDLRNVFSSPFDLKNPPSTANLRKFSEEHLARLSGPNADPALAELVAPTANAHVALFGMITNKATAQAVQENFTAANDLALEAYRAGVKRKEAAILDVFPKDDPGYQEFFPHGMEEYRRMNKGNAAELMGRMQQAVDNHAGAIGPQLSAFFQNLQTAYNVTRSTQLTRKGITDGLREDADALRKALEAQLYKNLHFIAFTLDGDVEKCMTYFDQSMVRDSSGGSKEEEDQTQLPL